MCGIAGFHAPDICCGTAVIEAMGRCLRHRGPDDEGYLIADTVSGKAVSLGGAECQVKLPPVGDFRGRGDLYLAHRRLSIIDTSPRGHQPMSGSDGRHWIVFNGEVYNYRELREELVSLGYRFKTGTDTEVVLTAYDAWGLESLERFNGMWAFALYDVPSRRIFLCRDRFGVKPLYYIQRNGLLAFASEMKALAVLEGKGLRPDLEQIFDYLLLGWEGEGGKTFFANVRELEPSMVLEYNIPERSLAQRKYYRLPVNDESPHFSAQQAQDYAQETAELLQRAVELRLRSDVRVGSCLSGGLDSSAIVCSVNRMLGRGALRQVGERQALFTAGYLNYSLDERAWAKMVAEDTASSWHVTYPGSRELLEDIEDLAYYQDAPFISTSIYAQYRVMKLAREQGVTVLLDGQGGDELFGGYASFYQEFYAELMARGRWGTLREEWSASGDASVSRRGILSMLAKAAIKRVLPPNTLPMLYRRMRPESVYIRPEFWQAYRHRVQAMAERRHLCLNDALRHMMAGRSLKNLLRYEDRNSMRFSIESRTPFADDLPLIERLFAIPGVYKIHRGWSKYLLRLATEGLVPDEIRWRRDKVGFATPELDWLRETGQAMLEYLDGRVSQVIEVERIKREWPAIISGQSPQGVTTIWRFLNLGVWAKVFRLNL